MTQEAMFILQNEMANNGYYPKSIICDGNFHKFSCDAKKHKRNRWYNFHVTDDVIHGAYGDWRTGETYTYTSLAVSKMNWLQRINFDSATKKQKAELEKQKAERIIGARKTATYISTKINADIAHDYAVKKKIGIADGCGIHRDILWIPAIKDGIVAGMQKIFSNGEKRWIVGTPPDVYFPMGNFQNPQIIYIGEGYATMYSVWLAVQCECVVAFNKANLSNTATVMREKYPQAKIIICADKDNDNGGEIYANKAASLVGGAVALCPIDSDFNDMHVTSGLERLRGFLLCEQPNTEEKQPLRELPTDKILDVVKTQNQMELPAHLLNAPNLVGMLAKWINDTSLRYQPNLSLAASLSAIGLVMAHRYATETNLRSNIMTLGLSASGSGKDHARKCVESLFELCDMSDFIIGDFASDAGVITALHKRGGIGLSMSDEIGDALAAMSSAKAAGYESRIMKITKELFSSASSVYRGKEYANHDNKQEAKILTQPCYCAYGTATHKQFYVSMSSDKILDGFLSRWLVFCGDGYAKKDKSRKTQKPPQKLINAIKTIRLPTKLTEKSETGSTIIKLINPKKVITTNEAQQIFYDLDDTVELLRISEFEKQSGLDAIYARTLEHAYKLALVAHNIETGDIDEDVAKWACELAMTISNNMIVIANDNISNSDYERDMMAIFEYIKSGGKCGKSKTQIANRFRIPSKIRNEAILHLLESEKLCLIEEVAKNGNKKQTLTAK